MGKRLVEVSKGLNRLLFSVKGGIYNGGGVFFLDLCGFKKVGRVL